MVNSYRASDICELSIREMAASIAPEGCRRSRSWRPASRVSRPESGVERVRDAHGRDRARRPPGARSRRLRARDELPAAVRNSVLGQGHVDHGRRTDHVRLAPFRGLRPGRGCGGGRGREGRRRHHARQDQFADAGLDRRDPQQDIRPDAEPMEPVSRGRRIERRRRRLGGGPDGAGQYRNRRRRLAAHSGVVHRNRRLQAVVRARAELSDRPELGPATHRPDFPYRGGCGGRVRCLASVRRSRSVLPAANG